MLFAFFCYNKECQNYRKDIEPLRTANGQDNDNESDNYWVTAHWPTYDDD